MQRRGFIALGLATAAVPLLPVRSDAAPQAELWPRWQAHTPDASRRIDHGEWAGVLRRYLRRRPDGVNRFDYAAVTPGDRRALQAYLGRLSSVRIADYDRDEQFAYWANLYNALTVTIVLRHWPVATIRDIDISPGLFADGPWGRKLVEVDGVALSLDDIEHRILRPIWRDPRIHYAVNCAALGCPELKPAPYAGSELNSQLDAAARDYVNHPRGAQVKDGRLTVSSIYTWYRADFGGSDAGVLAHLRRYAAAPLRERLTRVRGIDDHRYDWSINAPRAAART